MKTHCILLVNNDPEEINTMHRLVERMGHGVSLLVARNGREALDHLMGSTTSGSKPDIIIVSSLLQDMSAFELFSIVRKYYSLVNLKFFLLTDRAEQSDSSLDPLPVDGYLHRPLKADQHMVEKLYTLVSNTDKMRLTFFGGLSIGSTVQVVKGKMLALKAALTIPKIAIGVACVAVPCAIVVSSFKEDMPGDTLRNSAHFSPLPVMVEIEHSLPVRDEAEPAEVPVPETEVIIPQPEPVVLPDTTFVAIEPEQEDTVVYTKTFSIGVRTTGAK